MQRLPESTLHSPSSFHVEILEEALGGKQPFEELSHGSSHRGCWTLGKGRRKLESIFLPVSVHAVSTCSPGRTSPEFQCSP